MRLWNADSVVLESQQLFVTCRVNRDWLSSSLLASCECMHNMLMMSSDGVNLLNYIYRCMDSNRIAEGKVGDLSPFPSIRRRLLINNNSSVIKRVWINFPHRWLLHYADHTHVNTSKYCCCRCCRGVINYWNDKVMNMNLELREVFTDTEYKFGNTITKI